MYNYVLHTRMWAGSFVWKCVGASGLKMIVENFSLDRCITLKIPSLSNNAEGGARWLSGRVSDSGARGRGFETYRRRVVSLSKTLYSPKELVNYPGSDGSVPT